MLLTHSSSKSTTALPTPSRLREAAGTYLKTNTFRVLDELNVWPKIMSEVKEELARDKSEVAKLAKTASALERNRTPEAAGAIIVEKLLRNINELPVDLLRVIDKDSGWKPLVQILARTDKHARPEQTYFNAGGEQLTFKLLKGVYASKEDSGKEVLLLKKLATYQSHPHILDSIVTICGQGSNNPFKTARVAHTRLALISEPTTAKEEAGPKAKVYSGTGVSGIASTRRLSQIYDPSNPIKSTEAQEDALRSFFGAFAQDGVKEFEQRQKRISDRAEGLKAALLKLFKADIEDFGTTSKKESQIYERHKDIFEALRTHIEELRGKVIDLRYGDALLNFTEEYSTTKSDPGGSFLGRIGRLYKEKKLSEAARHAYEQLCGEEPLSIKDEKLCLEVLILEDRSTKSVNRKSIFAQFKADFNSFKEMQAEASNKSLLKELGLEGKNLSATFADVEDVLAKEGDINCIDAARVFRRFDFLEKFCIAVNRREAAPNLAEIQEGISKLKHLFLKSDGNWRVEAKGKSTPEGYLKERAAEAAAIGVPVEISHRSSAKPVAMFDAKELSTLKKMLTLYVVAGKSEERFYGSISVEEFKKLKRDFLVLCRKKNDFDKQFKDNPPAFIEAAEIRAGEDIASKVKSQKAPEKLRDRLSLLTNRNYLVAEEFLGLNGQGYFKDEIQIPLPELMARLKHLQTVRLGKNNPWKNDVGPILREGEVGLVRKCDAIKGIREAVKLYVPATELKDGLKVLANFPRGDKDLEMFEGAVRIRTPLTATHFLPHEAMIIKRMGTIDKVLESHGLYNIAANNKSMAEANAFETKVLVEGSIRGKQISVACNSARIIASRDCSHVMTTSDSGSIKFIVPEKLNEEIKKRNDNYTPGSELPAGWFEKLHRLSSGRNAQKTLTADTDSQRELNRLSANATYLYSRSFVEAVQNIQT